MKSTAQAMKEFNKKYLFLCKRMKLEDIRCLNIDKIFI